MRVTVKQDVSYDIETNHTFPNAGLLKGFDLTRQGNKVCVFIDECLVSKWADKIEEFYEQSGITAVVTALSAEEADKNENSLLRLVKILDDNNIHRRSEPVVAIGGGVITDLVGLAAALYRRGVPCIKVPTTLMGMVDAAIGIKTGIDFNSGKNRIGTFTAPLSVNIYPGFLNTLDPRHISNGLAEIIKLGLTLDSNLYRLCVNAGTAMILGTKTGRHADMLISESVRIMMDELQKDLFESNLKRVTDFGHTFSPAIEMHALSKGETMLHGEAVAIDMLLSCFISHYRGLIDDLTLGRITREFSQMNFPVELPSIQILWNGVQERVVHRNGKQHIVIPVVQDGNVGKHVFIEDLTVEELEAAVKLMTAWL